MLNYVKVMELLRNARDTLFIDTHQKNEFAQNMWQRMAADFSFEKKIESYQDRFYLPRWSGSLSDAICVERIADDYSAVGIDGSQIYPDRHQGTLCALLNIGGVEIRYQTAPHVLFFSEPHLIMPHDNDEFRWSVDTINCKRQQLELQRGLHPDFDIKNQNPVRILLFDGSVIFWHLDPCQNAEDSYFLAQYLQSLRAFEERDMLVAWYISLPRSKELVSLLKMQHALDMSNNGNVDTLGNDPSFNYVLDAHIVRSFLKSGMRSTIFKHNGFIARYYDDATVPHFFYLNTGDEIARIEIPAFIAQNRQKCNLVARVCLDQARKGNGYPVVLAEAHEQAVIKGRDRDFFYQLIYKLNNEFKNKISVSQKNLKKRRMGM